VLPQIVEKVNSMRTENDYFVCAHSGYAYANYSKMSDPSGFASSSAKYMKNCDMSTTFCLDHTVKDTSNFKYLLEQEQSKGVV